MCQLRYLLHFTHSVSCVGVEDILDCPRQGPVYIPLLVFLALLPASLLEILNQGGLVQISFITKLLNGACSALHCCIYCLFSIL